MSFACEEAMGKEVDTAIVEFANMHALLHRTRQGFILLFVI